MNAKEAREIIAFVEDEDGDAKLDNLVRETRHQFAKGYLAALEGPEVKELVETAINLIDRTIDGTIQSSDFAALSIVLARWKEAVGK